MGRDDVYLVRTSKVGCLSEVSYGSWWCVSSKDVQGRLSAIITYGDLLNFRFGSCGVDMIRCEWQQARILFIKQAVESTKAVWVAVISLIYKLINFWVESKKATSMAGISSAGTLIKIWILYYSIREIGLYTWNFFDK